MFTRKNMSHIKLRWSRDNLDNSWRTVLTMETSQFSINDSQSRLKIVCNVPRESGHRMRGTNWQFYSLHLSSSSLNLFSFVTLAFQYQLTVHHGWSSRNIVSNDSCLFVGVFFRIHNGGSFPRHNTGLGVAVNIWWSSCNDRERALPHFLLPTVSFLFLRYIYLPRYTSHTAKILQKHIFFFAPHPTCRFPIQPTYSLRCYIRLRQCY